MFMWRRAQEPAPRATAGAVAGLAALLLTSTAGLGCHAPQDYYRQTHFMQLFGEETRAESGRPVGEVLVPPEAELPVVVPMAVADDEPAGLIPAGAHARVMGPATDSRRQSSGPAAVRIAVDRERLGEFLRTRHDVGVVDAKAINGRFTNAENILRVEFAPGQRDDATVRREFMLICAVVVGMDREGTVDAVVGLAADAQLLPWMSLKASLREFEAYRAGELSAEEWHEQIETRRL